MVGRNPADIQAPRAHWDKFLAIKSYMDLAVEIEKYRPHYAIGSEDFLVSYIEGSLSILDEYRVKFVVFQAGVLPRLSLKGRVKNLFFGLSDKSKRVDCSEDTNDSKTNTVHDGLFRVATKLLYKSWSFIKNYRNLNKFQPFIALLAGNKSIDHYTSKSNPLIWIGSNDYHIFNKVKSVIVLNKNCKTEDFILFIDDGLSGAYDWKLLGLKQPVTDELYYPALNNFFEKIESIYDMPVKIAGHPSKETDENYQSNMGDRSVVFGNTALMALQSTIALVHGSTAISFAVLARKPIISLTSQELDQTLTGLFVREMSNALGSPLVFIDRVDKQVNDLKKLVVDEKKYSLYKDNYLCNELSTEIEPWGAFINFVNENRFV
jgi:hypothetical protein